jgi:hypothetical protein
MEPLFWLEDPRRLLGLTASSSNNVSLLMCLEDLWLLHLNGFGYRFMFGLSGNKSETVRSEV